MLPSQVSVRVRLALG